MNDREIIQELIKLAYMPHYSCEDTWYNCPKHPEGSANDYAGTKCNCGADEHNQQVEKLYRCYMIRQFT